MVIYSCSVGEWEAPCAACDYGTQTTCARPGERAVAVLTGPGSLVYSKLREIGSLDLRGTGEM